LTAFLFCETLNRVTTPPVSPVTPDERLAAISGKLDIVIRHVEIDRRLVDGFDDRIARLEDVAKKQAETAKMLADAAMRLSIARVASVPSLRILTLLVIAAVAGGAAGGVAVAGRRQSNSPQNQTIQPTNLSLPTPNLSLSPSQK
jgi:hypothetical protein